uniref:Alcohol oxidase n=1 Tax=Ganoderma boninense TaxID=34458 RepID=A0A5K1K3S0_9APHY|nr:Alcohol oxidase [Ganoderma boninense]
MMSPPSFTLVHDQPNHKSPQYSTTPDSIRELRTSVDSRQPSLLDRDRKLSPAFSSLQTPPPAASPRNESHFYEHFAQAPSAAPQDVFDACPEDGSQSASVEQQSSKHRKSWRTISSASSSSKDFFVCDDLDSSNSTYSQASLQDSFGARNTSQASSRRATEGSFASLTSSDSRRRKFAVRRQAIYAEYGFKLAFPDSDSSSSIRHTHMPTSSSRDFLETTGSSRATSAYVDSRSVWSASTSAASIRSQMMQHDGESADEDDDEKPEGPGSSIMPYPSARSLANLSNVERFSVQDAFLSSSCNPLLDDHADLTTSTPPAKPRSQTQHPASFKRITQLTSLPGVEARLPVSNTQVYTCGPDWHPWPPLRLSGVDAENGGSIIRRSSSTLERAQMFAKWQDDPGHHPIIQELLNAVDLAIREWGVGLFAIGKYV